MKTRTILSFLLVVFSVNGLLAGSGQPDAFPLNLLFSREDLPRIRENTRLPVFEEYWRSILDADFEKDGNFMREAFVYVVTGDARRGENARQGMLSTLERKRWDMFVEDGNKPLGFLSTGRLNAWMALSYDWIYDLLSPAEREEVLRQIAEKGCVPSYRSLHGMRYPELAGKWGFDPENDNHFEVPDMSRWPTILGHNNFRAVISGGFALGLFALEGRDERFDMWLEMLLDSIERSAALYGADGSYDEGINYCNYANTYLVYFMEVMRRKRGLDFFDRINFVGMMDRNLDLFFPHFLDPSGSVNFGDAGPSMNSSNLFWVARNSRDGVTQYQGLHHATRHDLFSLLYYDPSVREVPPSSDDYFSQLEFDWIVARTGYALDDLVVAMRSGPPSNHEHADRNSVILKYAGEILLADSKRPTYDRNNPGWMLRTSPAHNTLLIDGKGHQYHNGEEGTNASKASARIIRKGQRTGYEFWSSDATPAYALMDADVQAVTRTVLVFDEIPFTLILDKIRKNLDPSSFTARWFVENSDRTATIETCGNTFSLKRPNARFYGVCAGSQPLVIEEGQLPIPESIGVFPHVDVRTTDKSTDAFILLAGCPLKLSEEKPVITIRGEDPVWDIQVEKGERFLKLRVFDKGDVPEFEVLEYR